jgi:NADH:ubiquinone oxidoreductase subunit
MLRLILRIFTWWDGQTLNTQFWSWRNGVKVGDDIDGNRFYQNHDGSRRWVIYNGEAEASRVSPEWHGWLHQTYQDPPNKEPLPRKSWEKEHLENMTGTEMAYAPLGSLRARQRVPRSDYEAWTPE